MQDQKKGRRASDCGMRKATIRTERKSPYSWNPCATRIRESCFLWDTNSDYSSMLNTLLGSMEGIKHKIYLIDNMIISRFINVFDFQVSKGHTMRIKEQDARWQIVSCRSNQREHSINSFIAWIKPKILTHVKASSSLICMTWKQGKSFTIWQHSWYATMTVGYTHILQLQM
jgi:hypothetical protein